MSTLSDRCLWHVVDVFGIMVYLEKQIKTSNMLQQRAEGVGKNVGAKGACVAKDLHLRHVVDV